MFKLLKNHRGQGVTLQYVMTFFLVVGVVIAMTVYVKRAVQGRIRDARWYMVRTVNDTYQNAQLNVVGNLYLGYEPYYVNATADKGTASSTTWSTPAAGGSSQTDYNSAVTTRSQSIQAPPIVADNEYR